jgi:hypothetical protein
MDPVVVFLIVLLVLLLLFVTGLAVFVTKLCFVPISRC